MHSIRTKINPFILPSFVLLIAVFLFPEWRDLFGVWWGNVIYSHGFAVLISVIVLLWSRRKNLDVDHLEPSIPWLIALTICTVLMIIGRTGDILTLRLFILPFLIVCWGCSLWGQRFFRQATAPIMLLIFAVPIWFDMSPVFQFLTVTANQFFLHIIDIQATIHQYYIETPRGTFQVAEACSGVRYLMAGLFIASLYSILHVKSAKRAALIIFIGGALAVVGNWIRVLGVVIIGYETHMQSSVVHHHEKLGWVVFLICAMVPFFWIARRLEGKETQLNNGSGNERTHVVKGGWLTVPVLTALIVGSLPIITLITHYSVSHSEDPILSSLPEGNTNWTGPIRHANFWTPDYKKPDINVGAVYISRQRKQVELFLIGYRQQSQGHELVYYQNKLYRENEWEHLSSRTISLKNNTPYAPKKVQETVLKKPGTSDPIVIWSWYRTGNYQTTSKLLVKLVGGMQDLAGSSTGQLIAVAMRCSGANRNACGKEQTYLTTFINEMIAPSLAKESHRE